MSANAMRALGRAMDEAKVVKKMGPGVEVYGTPEAQVKAALTKLAAHGEAFQLVDAEVAWRYMRSWLVSGWPVALAVDEDEHWVAAIGVLGDRVLVADSADPELVLSYTRDQLLDRWRKPGDPPRYYGIVARPGRVR
jgi:hypothetical protein